MVLVSRFPRPLYERSADACGPIRNIRFLDASGEALPIRFRSWPHRVDLDITGRTAAVAFVEPDLLMLRLSRGRWRLELTLALDRGQHIASVEVGEGGMNVRVDEADGSPGYAWATNARIADHSIDDHPAHDPIVSVELDADSEAALFVGRGDAAERTRQPCRPDEVLDAAASRWARLLDRVPSVGAGESEPLLRAAWTLATNTVRLALDELASPAVVPSKMGYVALWQWDAYFHAIGLRHLDLGMAREQLRLALRWQTTDGMLPDLVHDEGVVAMSDDMDAADRQRSLLHIGRKSTSEQQGFLIGATDQAATDGVGRLEAIRDRSGQLLPGGGVPAHRPLTPLVVRAKSAAGLRPADLPAPIFIRHR